MISAAQVKVMVDNKYSIVFPDKNQIFIPIGASGNRMRPRDPNAVQPDEEDEFEFL